MRGDFHAFNGLVCALLVRAGADEKLKDGKHVAKVVYTEMLLQISRDYAGLPDVRELTFRQIKFFYEGLRGELRKGTLPRG